MSSVDFLRQCKSAIKSTILQIFQPILYYSSGSCSSNRQHNIIGMELVMQPGSLVLIHPDGLLKIDKLGDSKRQKAQSLISLAAWNYTSSELCSFVGHL